MNIPRHYRGPAEFLVGGIFGALLFFAIYGFSVLDPADIGWCLAENTDTGQHFIGGWAFLRDPWRWPPGIFHGLSHPDPASIAIIDGIPVAALAVKLFRGARPEPFQYLGWWGLVCFFLQGGFAALLMRRISRRSFFRLAGIFFLVMSVPFLTRYPLHTALSSHFLILWALYLTLGKWNGRSAAVWTALLVLASAIHPYLAGMCLPLYIGVTLREMLRRIGRRETGAIIRMILNWAAATAAVLLTAYLLGYFSIGVESAGCFGQTRINLNGLVNPVDWNVSSFVAPMPCLPFVENIYMGLGLLLLVAAALPKLRHFFRRRSSLWRRHGLTVAALLAMVLFAVGCRVCLGRMVLVNFLPPQWYIHFGRIFQAAGRFAWPAWYALAALAVGMAGRIESRFGKSTLVGAAMLLQILDIGRGIAVSSWAKNYMLHEREYVSPYAGIRVPEKAKRLCHSADDRDFCDVGFFALKNGLVTEDFCFSRRFRRTPGSSALKRLLDTGEVEADCIYLFTPTERAEIEKRHPKLKGAMISTCGRSVLIGGEAESSGNTQTCNQGK